MQGDPVATVFIGGPWSSDKSREVTGLIVAAYPSNPWEWWAVADNQTDRVMGACWLGPLRQKWCNALGWGQEIELGYRYAKEYWGNGYATEAAHAMLRRGFGELGLRRIVGIVDVGNAASERVLKKLGMSPAGAGTHEGVTIRGYRLDAAELGKSPAVGRAG
jgi:RimJ/RimL family protein N-acetyltransferase